MIREGARPREPDLPGFKPARIVQVDIGQPLTGISAVDPHCGRSYRRALSIVSLHTQPLGVVEIPLPEHGLSAVDYARHIWLALGDQITEHLREDGLPAVSALGANGIQHPGQPRCLEIHDQVLADPPFVSVVIPTRDRPDQLAVCLRSVRALEYPHYEIIVVDNVPRSDATAELVRTMIGGSAPRVHYVREDEPGLSAARNRGLSESKGAVVAFTDDDVVVDGHWLTHLVAGFRRADGVACVTGNILPAELETPAQSWLEQFGGFSKGFTRRVFDRSDRSVPGRVYPYSAGIFGSGANAAFRTSILRGMGGFDPALGAGTLARGGEDLAAFFTTISRGYRLVYEPAAIIYHHDRRDYAGLRDQIHGYGVGLTAYLAKCMLDDPRRVVELLGRIPQGIRFTARHLSPNKRSKSAHYPSDLTRAELLGMAYGPFAYIQSRRRRARIFAARGRQS
ncbi:MAG: glycosyltransferase family 2 protein [Dehalococcoidia bacterium]|nr:glycosyltransferase family 2 protein [Dehalococcoidia bacterium]